MSTRRIIKISAIGILSLAGLIVIGAVALVTFVNPNTFKPLISKSVYESTGRKLAIDGNISWKLWPGIGLKIEKLSLSNPEGFTPVNMLDVSQATISVELMPLLNHNLIIDNIIIDGLTVGLIKKGGLNNWTFTPITPQTPANKEEAAQKPMQLELNKFILTHSTFSYNDMDKNKQYNVKDFSFKLQTDHGGEISFDQEKQNIILKKVELSFDDIINAKLNFLANNFDKLTYQGDVDIDKFSVGKLTNKLNQPVAALNGKDLFNQVALSTAFKGDLNSIIIDGFKFNLSDIVKGVLNIKVNNFTNPAYSGDINLDEFSANSALDKMGIAVAARKDNQLLNKVVVKTKFSGDENNVSLQQLNFSFPDVLQGLASIKLQNFSNPTYSGDVNLNEFSANALLDKMNIDNEKRKNNQLLNKVVVKTNFSGTKDSVNLQQFNFNFPGIVHGLLNLNVQNFDKPSYSGDINLPTFSLNQVMAKSAQTPIDIPNKHLLDSVSLQTNFNATSNSVNLTNLVNKISGSTLTGSINIPSIKPLSVVENIHIDKIDVADLTDVNGYRVPLTNLAANGSFSNSTADFKTMSGVSANQNIMIDNVTVLGFDLNNLINQFDNALTSTGKAVTLENMQPLTNSARVVQSIQNMKDIAARATSKGAKDLSKKTNFGMLQSNLVMHNGIANPSSFKISGPTIKGDGKGSVNMVDKSLNYAIAVQIVAPQKNQILNKIIFPYTATGKFDNVQGSVDWLSIQKQMIEYLITQTTEQTKALIKDQVNGQINNLTKGASPQIQQQVDTVKQGANNLINNIFK